MGGLESTQTKVYVTVSPFRMVHFLERRTVIYRVEVCASIDNDPLRLFCLFVKRWCL